MNNIEKMVYEIMASDDSLEYLEIANYVIIYLDDPNRQRLQKQVEEYVDANFLREMCKWGITPGTQAIAYDIRFGFEQLLFNSDDISDFIYDKLYDYIEEEVDKHCYETMPYYETTDFKNKMINEITNEISYEEFEKELIGIF